MYQPIEFNSLVKKEEVFTVDHLHDIRTAVVCVLNSIGGIIDNRHEGTDSYFDMTQNLNILNEELFKGIHDRYLWWTSTMANKQQRKKRFVEYNLHGHGSHLNRPRLRAMTANGIAVKYSRIEADRFLQSLIIAFDSCKSTLLQSLKRRSNNEVKLGVQLRNLKSEYENNKRELTLATTKLDDRKREKENWCSRINNLDEQLKLALEKIEYLQENSSYLDWQNKYSELEERHQKQIENLTAKLTCEREKYKNKCLAMKNKIKKLEFEVTKIRVKSELIPTFDQTSEKLNHANRQIFLKDQEIFKSKRDFENQQQAILGCMNGLQHDFRGLVCAWESEKPGRKFSPDPEKVKYQAMLRYIHESVQKGNLSENRLNMPPHYRPTKNTDMQPIENKGFQSKENKKDLNAPNERGKGDYLLPTEVKIRSNSVSGTRFNNAKETVKRPTSAKNYFQQTNKITMPSLTPEPPKKVTHPQLVSKVTGRANIMLIMQHFPYLNIDQVKQQWDNFRKYDKNNDFSLDLPELYEVLHDVCGLKVSISEMKEAMREVDRDQSNDIDFYEYLKIAEMVIKKQGHSSIFQADEIDGRGVSTSRDCCIQ